MLLKSKSLVVLILVLVLGFMSCSTVQVVSSLQNVIAAVEFAVPIIGSVAGVPPAVTDLVVVYLQAASEATDQSAVILASDVSSAQKTAQIVALFSKVVVPVLPPGTPQAIGDAVAHVAQAIVEFLARLTPKSIGAAPPKISISVNDRAKLSQIRDRSADVRLKLKAVKH